MRDMLDRLFYGRNGIDQLNIAALLVAVVCLVASQCVGIYLLRSLFHFASLLIAAVFCMRALSRNLERRSMENQRFLGLLGRQKRGHRASWQVKLAQRRQYKIFKCPSCGLKLRVPRGKGKVCITCRQCGASFEEKC